MNTCSEIAESMMWCKKICQLNAIRCCFFFFFMFRHFFFPFCSFDLNWLLFTSFCYSPHCVALLIFVFPVASVTNSKVVILCTAHDLIDISIFVRLQSRQNKQDAYNVRIVACDVENNAFFCGFKSNFATKQIVFVAQSGRNEWLLSSAIEREIERESESQLICRKESTRVRLILILKCEIPFRQFTMMFAFGKQID